MLRCMHCLGRAAQAWPPSVLSPWVDTMLRSMPRCLVVPCAAILSPLLCAAAWCSAETRAYTARYDRIYLRGLSAAELRLVADRECTLGRGDFLSDHFGLLATVDIPQQPPPSPAGRQQQPGGARQGRGPAQG